MSRPIVRSLAQAAALVVVAGLIVALPATRKAFAAADDAQQVEEFLSRLGLVDLQILHLENSLETQDPKQGAVLARRLADLYAARLMDFADDKPRYDDMLARIRKLGKRFPNANTTALQVMLLQADFNRAEAQIKQWIEERGGGESLQAGTEILGRIAPQLHSHQVELNKEVDALTGELAMIEDPKVLKVKEAELRRKRDVAGRATFFAGWANYYLALTQLRGGDPKPSLEAAKSAFRRILGISAEDKYEEIEEDWFDLQISFLTRAVIGLGNTEIAAGNIAGAEQLYKLLDTPTANQAMRDLAPAFFLQGLINANMIAEVQKYAPPRVEAFTGSATQGKVTFCVTLIGLGYAGKDAPEELKTLGDLGIRGLARMQQIATANQVLTKYGITLDDPSGFYLNWLKGYQQYTEAQKTKSAEDYLASAKTLEKALADSQARSDVVSAGQCRYTLGWCLYSGEQYEQAAEQFLQASTSLKGSPGGLDVESAWMAFASYYKLAAKERRYATSAVDVLEDIKRDFPNSDQAKKADPLIAGLRRIESSPEETIASLNRVGPGEPNYVSARFDLCRLDHQMWSKSKTPEEQAKWAAELRSAADTYSRAARNDGNTDRKLRVVLWTADLSINSDAFDQSGADRELQKAAQLAENLPTSSSAVHEYHYKQFQFAEKSNDDAGVEREAQWLAENAAGSVYEQAALVFLAQKADRAVSSASAADRRKMVEQAADIYRRLVRFVGESPKVIAEVPNARVANYRLAQYDYELENFADAANRAERLVAAFESDRDYLRLAGLAQYYAGAPEKAIEHWRLLVQGLAKNSPPWHEAKYYQLACLAQSDKAQAVKVYQQFKLLYPSVDVEPWRSDREGLKTKLAG